MNDVWTWMTRNRRLLGAGGGILLVWMGLLWFFNRGPELEGGQAVYEVQRGPLEISFSQVGTIQALEQDIITCEVQGRTTIIYIIEEGTRVAEGDLLIELDASVLQDNLVEQDIKVQNAEANFIRSREQLEVTKSQAESDIAQAKLDYQFAQEDLEKYTEGEYLQQLREAESKITLAAEEVQLARCKLEWSETLYQEEYLSQADRDADSLAYNRAQLDLELAETSMALLTNYTYRRERTQLKSDVEQNGRALERARLKANANIVQAEADLKAKEAELLQQKNKLKKIEEQISKTRITAPRNGLVVYATSVRANWRGSEEPLDAGQEVRERQELIYLPAAERMKAEIQIHESNLNKIRLGLPAVVTVEALEGKTFLGSVSRIAPLPDAALVWMNPDLKVYRTDITIDGLQPELRTGMSCKTEVIAEQYRDVLSVPIQAVVFENGQHVVYIQKGRRFLPVPVTIGMDNNRLVHVVDGLKEGQQVLLTPPLEDRQSHSDEPNGASGMEQEKIRRMIDGVQQAGREHAAAPAKRGEADGRADEKPAGRMKEQRRPPAGGAKQSGREASL